MAIGDTLIDAMVAELDKSDTMLPKKSLHWDAIFLAVQMLERRDAAAGADARKQLNALIDAAMEEKITVLRMKPSF